MIKLTDFYIKQGKAFASFLVSGLSISTVCAVSEIKDKTNDEIVDYMYSLIKCHIDELELEDTTYEYIKLNLDNINDEIKTSLTMEELAKINNDNVNAMNLITMQRMRSDLLRYKDEVSNLKQLLADLTMIQLGV